MGTTLTIRNLDAAVKQKLRVRSAMHGRSMEAEAREILARGVQSGSLSDTSPATTHTEGKFDHLAGLWKGRGTTDEMMRELRSED